MKNGLLRLTILAIALNSAACANKEVASSTHIIQASAEAAESASMTPEEALSNARASYEEAEQQGLDFFSPLHLRQAKQSIEDAASYLQKPPKDIRNASLMSAIAAQSFIEKAYENKQQVEQNLKLSIEHKRVLDELSSAKIEAEQYQDMLASFDAVIKLIESGETAKALEQEKALIKEMSALEVSTLNNIHLSEAQQFLDKADDIDAEDFAAKSFEQAESSIEKAERFIAANYRNRKGVAKAGEQAITQAKKAYYHGLEARKLINLTAEDAERYVIDLNTNIANTYAAFNQAELEPQGIASALDLLKEKIVTLREESLKLQSQLKEADSGHAATATNNDGIRDTRPSAEQSAIEALPDPEAETVTVISVLPGFEPEPSLDDSPSPSLDSGEQFDSIEMVDED